MQAAFEFLANDLVLPAVRSALVNEWEVRKPAPALALAEAMVRAHVGDGIVQSLLEQVRRCFCCRRRHRQRSCCCCCFCCCVQVLHADCVLLAESYSLSFASQRLVFLAAASSGRSVSLQDETSLPPKTFWVCEKCDKRRAVQEDRREAVQVDAARAEVWFARTENRRVT